MGQLWLYDYMANPERLDSTRTCRNGETGIISVAFIFYGREKCAGV